MLQVIKAEDVRDGEPRWWCPDDAYAARTLEWIVTGNLHTEWRREADAFTLAIVDRPAPTPTPAPGLDLDAVERDVAHLDGPHSLFDDRTLGRVLAVCNAAPALIAEVRALRAAAEEREADMHARIRAGYDKTVADAWRAEVAKRDAEIADLRALVESQRRDYLDVCDAIAPETSGPADAAAKVRALRAKLAEAKRLGRDACELAKAYADELIASLRALADAPPTVAELLPRGDDESSRPSASSSVDLATVRAALDKLARIWPGPLGVRRFVDDTGNDAAAVIDVATGETIATCDNEDRDDHATPVEDAGAIVALRNAAPAIAALADECERLRATALCHSAARADLYTAYLAAKGDPTLREALRAFFKATEDAP